MLGSALITFREGLEAALIVGIVLGVLRKPGRADRNKLVWAGVVVAVFVSIAAGLALNALGVAFQGRGEEGFEGVTMLLAAFVLTWMMLWMGRQGRQIQTELEGDVRRAASTNNEWALIEPTAALVRYAVTFVVPPIAGLLAEAVGRVL